MVRPAVDVHVMAPGFGEDAGRDELTVGIVAARP